MSNILMGIQSAFQMIDQGIGTMKDLAADYAEMDDVYADVMKTTGLTKEQVLQLNESFRKMDTRTSREQLNQLAYEAGKLGLSTSEAVGQFVSASDKINIALGDVLGDGAMVTIGKLADVYAKSTKQLAADGKTLEERMLAIGSAVNQLGQESTANEGYLVEFLSRMGGIATQANLSADAILGYAAALDQDMMKQEMSATAFQKFIMQMIKKPAEFAQAAGMEVSKFADLMQKDMNEALLSVLKGFQGQGGMIALQPIFEDLGLDAARAASVISSMANSIDEIRAAQASANEQLATGNSIMKEFTTKNTTMQAQAEKAKKRFQDVRIELGEKLYPVLIHLQKTGTVSLKALSMSISLLSKYPWLLGSIAVVLVDLNRKRLKNLATKVAEYATDLKRAAQTRIENAQSIITRANLRKEAVNRLNVTAATKAATKAQITLNAVMKATPWWLVVSAVSAVVTAIGILRQRNREAADSAKELSQRNADLAQSSMQVRNQITVDIQRAQQIVSAHQDESDMLSELNSRYGDVFGTYSTLGQWLDVLKSKTEDYVNALYLQAKVQQNIEDATAIDKEMQTYKENGPQFGGFGKRVGRSMNAVGGYINTFVGNLTAGDSWKNAAQAASEEFIDIQDQPFKDFNDHLNQLENRKKDLLDDAAKTQQEIAQIQAKSGINVNGTIGSSTPTAPSSFLTSSDPGKSNKNLDKWKSVASAAEDLIAEFRNKALTGAEEIYASIDARTNDMLKKIEETVGATKEEKDTLAKTLTDAANAYKRAKLDEYLDKYRSELQKAAADPSGNELIDKINQVAESLRPYDEKIRQLKADQQALADTDKEAAARIAALIQQYEQLKTALADRAYLAIDTSVDTSDFALTGDRFADYKKYNEYTQAIERSRAAATRLLEVTTDPAQRAELEAQIEDLGLQQQNLDNIYKGFDDFEKKIKKSKALDNFINSFQTFGDKALEIFGSINQILDNISNRELRKQEELKEQNIKLLDDQLSQQLISQETYDQRKAAIDEEYSAKQKEIELEQWRREKWLNASEAAMAAALAILRVWSDAGNGTTAMRAAQTAVVGAATLAQMIAIASEPEPYAHGGYVNADTVFRAGEAGSEWIAPHRLLTDPLTAPVIQSLEDYRRGRVSMAAVNMPAVNAASSYLQDHNIDKQLSLLNSQFSLLSKYLSDPRNRQAVISRKTQEDFDHQEQTLRNFARL